MSKVLSFSPCFKAGTQVLTKVGYKDIELVCSEDEVLSHENNWVKVKGVNQAEDKALWKIRTHDGLKFYVAEGQGFYTSVANSHNFSVPMFKSVEDLTSDDYLISIVSPNGSGQVVYDYDRVMTIEKTDRVVTVYGVELINENDFALIVNDRIVRSL